MGTTKVTYVTLSADSEDARAGFSDAIAAVEKKLGAGTALFIGATTRTTSEAGETISRSPIDTRVVVGTAPDATSRDVQDAIAAANAAFPAWRETPWQQRCHIVRKAADLIRARRYELSIWMIHEMGKNRAEALGEVEETADLFTYYADRMDEAQGFVRQMGRLSPSDTNTSVMRPYGVWAVISPWNFPFALLGSPIAAALIAGNTVVAKPSTETPIIGFRLAELLIEAGVPRGVFNFVTGDGKTFGDAIIDNPDVAGLTFTGSYDVGFNKLHRRFATVYPRPCIVEMGGKNPAIVMPSADLDRVVQGVYRAAFGMNGHKCSACSRLYVHEDVADEIQSRLIEKMKATDIGSPIEREVFVGPLATQKSLSDQEGYIRIAREAGKLVHGGARLSGDGFDRGFFVQPALVAGLPEDHALMKDELFVPILCVNRIRSLDEALAKANDTHFGLTAGFFSREQKEIDTFLERIEAGVVYVNRAAGATTGAWPGVQPFGGWKGSGSTGKNIGGHYTLPCYLREQSRTIVSS